MHSDNEHSGKLCVTFDMLELPHIASVEVCPWPVTAQIGHTKLSVLIGRESPYP